MSFVAPPGTRRGLRDWTELIFKDHGFLRIWWHNLHEVAPGMWRCNQPGPSRVRAAAGMGIRTIINLRGPRTMVAGGSRRKPARRQASPFSISRRGHVRHPTRPCSTLRGICSPKPSFRP